jgi:hypothetical protein
MDRLTLGAVGGFHEGFAQGGVSVHVAGSRFIIPDLLK